jgi:tetratricopeptide (TPR) repeat protein
MRLNPHCPIYYLWARAQNYLFMRRFQEALEIARQLVQIAPTFIGAYNMLTVSLALAGQIDDARRIGAAEREAMLRLRETGEISDEAMRLVQRDLDLQASRFEGQAAERLFLGLASSAASKFFAVLVQGGRQSSLKCQSRQGFPTPPDRYILQRLSGYIPPSRSCARSITGIH